MKKYIFPTLFSLIGNLITGAAVGLMRLGGFGVDPFSAMNLGISKVLSIQFGTLQLCVNLLFLLIVLINDKRLIGIGTIFNMVLVGYTADFTVWVADLISNEPYHIVIRALLLVLGVVLACFGVGTYLCADVGTAPYDGLCLTVNKWFKDKIQYKHSRMGIDFMWVIVAVICGLKIKDVWSLIGITTVIMAFCTGPLVQFFSDRFAIPLLKKLQEKIMQEKA